MELVPGAKEVGDRSSKGWGAGISVLEDSAGVCTGRPRWRISCLSRQTLVGPPCACSPAFNLSLWGLAGHGDGLRALRDQGRS